MPTRITEMLIGLLPKIFKLKYQKYLSDNNLLNKNIDIHYLFTINTHFFNYWVQISKQEDFWSRDRSHAGTDIGTEKMTVLGRFSVPGPVPGPFFCPSKLWDRDSAGTGLLRDRMSALVHMIHS